MAEPIPEIDLARDDIGAYLARYREKELLRFVAIGSVDDGKSTLIGRLLHDTGMVYEDQLSAVKKASSLDGEVIDFALLTDGLSAEREQGITIDVAYRYFSTAKRKFIIADTPGHVQYTRNMVTGASTANLALILIDARLGVLRQSRRHAYIASLLGIPHLCVCINKMDLVGFDESVFSRIKDSFSECANELGIGDTHFFPVSALKGDNLVEKSTNMRWYSGPPLLSFLETVPVNDARNYDTFRLSVQRVVRPHLDYRGFAGQITSGSIKKGDTIRVLPSQKTSKVTSISIFEQTLDEAVTPQSVTLTLADEIDISRGDLLVRDGDAPAVDRHVEAHLVWMGEEPLDLEKTYWIKHTTRKLRAQIERVHWKKDMDTLEQVSGDSSFGLNDVGYVTLACHKALYFDAYEKSREMGAFILIDSLSNNTVAAGMIAKADAQVESKDILRELRAGSAIEPKTQVSSRERERRVGHKGLSIWLIGMPGSGRWTLAYALERKLFDMGRVATVIDPTREDLNSMMSSVRACTKAGVITICAFPNYTHEEQALIKRDLGTELMTIYVNTDPALCRERRPDANFDDFQAPVDPDVTVSMSVLSQSLDELTKSVVRAIDDRIG